MFRAMTILFAALLWAAPAAAQSDGIVEKFFGAYDGKGTWGTGMLPRAMSVVIKPRDEGFTVTWDSKSLKDPRRPKNKSHSMEFLKTAQDGVYVTPEHKDRTDIPAAANPMAGPLPAGPLIWVRVDGDRMSLYALKRSRDGDEDVQVYHRTVTGDRMKLHFIRYHNGVPLKQTKGKLRRVTD